MSRPFYVLDCVGFYVIPSYLNMHRIRDPLVVWRGTLIDGHNRYDIAQKHGLEFQVVEKDFEDETAAKIWMVTNQFGRRNLNNYQRSVLALSMEELFKEKAKGNMSAGGEKYTKQGCQNSDKVVEEILPIDSKKELAKLANVSHDTIMRVKKIEATATPETRLFRVSNYVEFCLYRVRFVRFYPLCSFIGA